MNRFHFFSILVLLVHPVLVYSQQNLIVSVHSEKVQHPVITYDSLDVDKIKVVVTEEGEPIAGLTKENFEINTTLSRGTILNVQPLLYTEKAKISIVLCIDNSNSMSGNVDILKETVYDLSNRFGPSVKISTVFFIEKFSGGYDFPLRCQKRFEFMISLKTGI